MDKVVLRVTVEQYRTWKDQRRVEQVLLLGRLCKGNLWLGKALLRIAVWQQQCMYRKVAMGRSSAVTAGRDFRGGNGKPVCLCAYPMLEIPEMAQQTYPQAALCCSPLSPLGPGSSFLLYARLLARSCSQREQDKGEQKFEK